MKQITLRLPDDIAELVEQRAIELSISQNSVIVDTLRTSLTLSPPPDNMGVEITKSHFVRDAGALLDILERQHKLIESLQNYVLSLEERLRVIAAFVDLPSSVKKLIPLERKTEYGKSLEDFERKTGWNRGDK